MHSAGNEHAATDGTLDCAVGTYTWHAEQEKVERPLTFSRTTT
jgi:hypothetical protein